MKVSELNLNFTKWYLKIDYEDEDLLINVMLDAAKSYIVNFTGLTAEQVDSKPELTITCLCLVAHFYEQRGFIMEGGKVSSQAESIAEDFLYMHSVNYL